MGYPWRLLQILTIARGIPIALSRDLLLFQHAISTRRRALQCALAVCAAVGVAVALWDIAAGGFYFRIFGIRVSSWEASKPFRMAMIAIVAAMWLHDHDAPPHVATWHRMTRAAPYGAAAAALALLMVAIRFGIRAAGGADAYGYISQAQLWASGQLTAPNPLASVTASVGPAV